MAYYDPEDFDLEEMKNDLDLTSETIGELLRSQSALEKDVDRMAHRQDFHTEPRIAMVQIAVSALDTRLKTLEARIAALENLIREGKKP